MMWFDVILGIGLIVAALGVFRSDALFRSVVFFVTFGILLALTWLRLQAPDLALAEAAIGAGLTGVLLLDTLGVLNKPATVKFSLPKHLLAAVVAVSAAMGLAWSFWTLLQLPAPVYNLVETLAANIDDSGVSHGITAVLLNFRSYDTLLEVAVLLVAIVIGLGLRQELRQELRQGVRYDKVQSNGENDEQSASLSSKQANAAEHEAPALLKSLVHVLVPLLLITAIFVLWAGSTRPGGAFQAGALIAAAGVLARLGNIDIASRVNLLLRTGLTIGVFIFLLVAVSPMLTGYAFLAYPPGWAGVLIILIELMLTISIGLILLSLFIHAPREKRNGGSS